MTEHKVVSRGEDELPWSMAWVRRHDEYVD